MCSRRGEGDKVKGDDELDKSIILYFMFITKSQKLTLTLAKSTKSMMKCRNYSVPRFLQANAHSYALSVHEREAGWRVNTFDDVSLYRKPLV